MKLSLSYSKLLCQNRKFSKYLKISPAVRNALQNGEGVVALESTVITHGLPYPHNLSTARELEAQVRESGSQPATIALIDGHVHVGLNDEQLQRLASCSDASKVSTRDIAKTLVKKEIGGTTVAATMKIAHAAGIQVFATGGIGGVHRGAESTFDISADLQELSNTPVCVVCSGVKSILDIPKTVEYLETHSVNCVVLADENVFPSFFTPKSESKAQFNTTKLQDVVDLLNISKEMQLSSGTVLACPIPAQYAADGDVIQQAIDQAIREASEQKVASQKVTPFILARVNELTKGASMKTNIALLKNNAKIAGELARKLKNSEKRVENFFKPAPEEKKNKPKVVSIGAAIVDFEAITHEDVKDNGGSYAGEMVQRMGGVARNHADALARLGCDSIFISAVGNDPNADFFRRQCSHIDISRVRTVPNAPTATYLSMNVRGNVRYGVSTCEPIFQLITPQLITDNEFAISCADYVVIDSNLPTPVIEKALGVARYHRKKIWFEPTDIKKVCKAFDSGNVDCITATSPNANEFVEWSKFCGVDLKPHALESADSVLDFVSQKQDKLLKRLSLLIVSLAQKGTAVIFRDENGNVTLKSLPPPVAANEVVSVSGAGDSFNSGVIAGLVHGKPIEQSLEIGQKCAALTLKTSLAASDAITAALLR